MLLSKNVFVKWMSGGWPAIMVTSNSALCPKLPSVTTSFVTTTVLAGSCCCIFLPVTVKCKYRYASSIENYNRYTSKVITIGKRFWGILSPMTFHGSYTCCDFGADYDGPQLVSISMGISLSCDAICFTYRFTCTLFE